MALKTKRRPTHPGAILREDTLPAIGLTQSEFAEALMISRRTVNEVLNERGRITIDLAHRIGRALGMPPDIWLRMQQAVDLYDAQMKNKDVYSQIKRIAA
jgi:antitoxin HigA-1